MVEAGKLDRRVIIQKNFNADGSVRNEFSEPIPDWRDISMEWCSVSESGSREFSGDRKTYEESTLMFGMRYKPGIRASTHRFVLIEPFEEGNVVKDIQKPTPRQRIFNIFPPREGKGRFRELIIEAKEVF